MIRNSLYFTIAGISAPTWRRAGPEPYRADPAGRCLPARDLSAVVRRVPNVAAAPEETGPKVVSHP